MTAPIDLEQFLASPMGHEHIYQTVGLDRLNDTDPKSYSKESLLRDMEALAKAHFIKGIEAHIAGTKDYDDHEDDINDEFATRKNEVEEAAKNPDLGVANMALLGGVSPQVAEPVMFKHQQMLQRLQQELPKNPLPPSIFGDKWEPSDMEKRRWLGKVKATENPVEAMAHGDAAVRQFAAEVHPQTVNAFKQGILQKLSETPEEDIPYEAKLRLGNILGSPGLPSQDPLLSAQLQATWIKDDGQQQDSGHAQTARTQRAEVQKNKTIRQWYTIAQNLSSDDLKE